jgi:hypothetical protein
MVEEKEATSDVPSIDKDLIRNVLLCNTCLSFATDYPIIGSQFAL